MRVLVTGGAGFIGSHFVRYGLSQGASITVFDKLAYAGRLENLVDVADHPGYRFVRGDVCDRASLDQVVPGHHAIVHFAAETHVDRSIEGAGPFVQTNVVGTQQVLDAALAANIERFLLISTDEVYGSIPEPHRSDEDAPLRPNSPYSASKSAADLLARSYRVTYDYPVTITRTSNNFGPYQFPEKMVPLFVTRLLRREPVPVYGSGANVRDWLYVEDNVKAQWLVLTEGEPGGIYNVGAGNEITNLDLTRRLLDHLGLTDEFITHVPDRPGHDLRYAVDAGKLRALGWQPQLDLDEALCRTIDWYRHREDWWQPLLRRGALERRGVRPA